MYVASERSIFQRVVISRQQELALTPMWCGLYTAAFAAAEKGFQRRESLPLIELLGGTDRLHVCVWIFASLVCCESEGVKWYQQHRNLSHTPSFPLGTPPSDAFYLSRFCFSCEQEYVSLKTYDMVASSKGELERTRR